jgi:2-iminobutanoate/2-iminopropanoate deaminase
MKPTLPLLFALSALVCSCQSPPPERFHLSEKGEQNIGFCQAVRTGNLLFVSGAAGKGEMPQAIAAAYDKIGKTLAAYHLGFANIVKETVYTTDIDALKASNDARKAYYGEIFPAATWVQVNRLYSPKMVIEIEVVAVFPNRQ